MFVHRLQDCRRQPSKVQSVGPKDWSNVVSSILLNQFRSDQTVKSMSQILHFELFT